MILTLGLITANALTLNLAVMTLLHVRVFEQMP